MYQLEATGSYEEEFRAIAERLETLERELQKGLYFVLARNPRTRAQQVHPEGIWFRTQMVYEDPVPPRRSGQPWLIELFYRVDEERGAVILLSIRATDATRM